METEADNLTALLGLVEDVNLDPERANPPVKPPQPVEAPRAPQYPAGDPRKLFFTGRMKSGKDYLASRVPDATVLTFAEPLYELAKFFFGSCDKTQPGVRSFLQTVGQWGRGLLDGDHPQSVVRALFTHHVLKVAPELPRNPVTSSVEWHLFGSDPDIWLKALVHRAQAVLDGGGRVAVTGCRFKHEYEYLRKAGFQHWHVTCSLTSWTARLKAEGLQIDSPELNNISEQMAKQLDAQTGAELRKKGTHKLRVVWSCNNTPTPARLFSVAQFLEAIK